MEILKRGDSGPEVKAVQELLVKQGWYFDGDPGGNFGPITENAVEDFQFTHLGPDGNWLKVDGMVDMDTLWALENASGDPQRHFIEATVPKGIKGDRLKTLEVGLGYWRAGVHEVPDGANKGDGVDQFIQGYGPVPWCMLWVSHVDIEANGSYALKKREASTSRALAKAKEIGIFYSKVDYDPIPGDMFIMQNKTPSGHPKGTGHIGFVLAVSKDGQTFQTVEANCGNRVKVGERKRSDPKLEGWIRRYDDTRNPPKYERGLCGRSSGSVDKGGTR